VHSCEAEQAVPQPPQFAGSRLTSTQAWLQLVMHAVPQTPASHVGRTNAPVAAHAVQLAPHWLTASLGTQSPPQLLKPALQVNVQLVPLHAGVELAGPLALQGVHDVPQVLTSKFETQALPQR
jgi:hypothetical protein